MAELNGPQQELVADVLWALHPGAVTEVGEWLEGAGGDRELDVSIRGETNSGPTLVVIEFKDWNRPIGIEAIEALEGRRQDLRAANALICGMSGYTSGALLKAERVGISAISVVTVGEGQARCKLTRLYLVDSHSAEQFGLTVVPQTVHVALSWRLYDRIRNRITIPRDRKSVV